MTIVLAASRPGLQERLTTGDFAFDSAVFVAAAERSAYGLFDFRTRAVVRRLVVDWGVVFTDGALRSDHRDPSPAMLRDVGELAERLTKTEAEARAAVHTIALEDPVEDVRQRYRALAENTVFEDDLSLVDEASLLNDLSTVTSFEPLADLVRNPTASAEMKLTAMERLMAYHQSDTWEEFTGILADELPGETATTRLVSGFLAALEREETPRGESIDRLFDLAEHAETRYAETTYVTSSFALGICRLIQRAVAVPMPDIADVIWILQTLCEHPEDSVVLAALTLLYAIEPDQLRSLHWLNVEDFGKFLARTPKLARGASFERLLVETLNRSLRRGIASASESERHRTIALLAAYGHPEHLPILMPLTRGLFQRRRTKALAREAVEAIRRRHPMTHLEGAMSVAEPAGGGLVLVETKPSAEPRS